MIGVTKTAKFSVFELKDSLTDFQPSGEALSSEWMTSIQDHLRDSGMCLLLDAVPAEALSFLRESLMPVVAKLVSTYSIHDDEFENFDSNEWDISRMPRVGRGKHNIHFDVHTSCQHKAVCDVVSGLKIPQVLGCVIRETGLTMTCPSASLQGEAIPGEGMEWHSDGAAGEFTILMTMRDVESVQGCLKIVPRSHLEYVEGIGHASINAQRLDARGLDYCYRAGSPMLFDARTLHGVEPNHSRHWRVAIWVILDSY